MLRAQHVGSTSDTDRLAIEGLDAFHEHRLRLEDGERCSRLMVYEGVPAKAKQITLELGPLFTGPKTFSPVMEFLVDFPDEPKGRDRGKK